MKKIILSTLAIILVIAISFYVYQARKKQITKIEIGPIIESVYGIGVIKAHHRFHAKSGLVSVIKSIHVNEGDLITKGTKLLTLDQGISIFSPINGTVTQIHIDENEIVSPQVELVVVQDLNDLFFEVTLEQQGAARLKPEMKAKISFDNLSSAVLEGHVTAILPQDNKFSVHVASNQIPKNLLPGMSADVSFIVATKENAQLILAKAVNNGRVIKLNNGKKETVPVETGARDQDRIEILSPKFSSEDEFIYSL
jgi:multidrug efflux pump subunit AcrA (membrane-fusion protein)